LAGQAWHAVCTLRLCGGKQCAVEISFVSLQVILNSLIAGSSVALLAAAFQIVYLPTRVFFLALGGVYAASPYLVLATKNSVGWVLAVMVAAVVSVVVCALCERMSHGPLSRRNASSGAQMIASLGMYIALVQVIAMIWGNEPQSLRQGTEDVTRFNGLVITRAQWAIAAVAVVLLASLLVFLWRTNVGLRLRALADNPTQFALYGYNVRNHRILAFGMAGLFASAASITTAYDIGFEPHAGLHAVLLAVVAVIIGGRNSFIGPILGALLLCLIRGQVTWYLSARWQEPVTFLALAMILLVRPQGLFGKPPRLEAAS
jgi:branched-chain amino acid transport system permease protein